MDAFTWCLHHISSCLNNLIRNHGSGKLTPQASKKVASLKETIVEGWKRYCWPLAPACFSHWQRPVDLLPSDRNKPNKHHRQVSWVKLHITNHSIHQNFHTLIHDDWTIARKTPSMMLQNCGYPKHRKQRDWKVKPLWSQLWCHPHWSSRPFFLIAKPVWYTMERNDSCWLVVSTRLKNIRQNWNLPQIGVKMKNVWNHHLAWYVFNLGQQKHHGKRWHLSWLHWSTCWAWNATIYTATKKRRFLSGQVTCHPCCTSWNPWASQYLATNHGSLIAVLGWRFGVMESLC